MTFNVGHIAGGTNSRCRVVRQAAAPWACLCAAFNPGYRTRCECGKPRPKNN